MADGRPPNQRGQRRTATEPVRLLTPLSGLRRQGLYSGVAIIDARSPAEYSGRDKRAERAGHIPGAVNLNWTTAMDQPRKLRLKQEEVLRQMLSDLGVTPDKEVIVYCQTHHRSSHTYIMLKALGYPNVKAYPGSWAEWGNSPETPIE
jgi:thiosulfate/3-mercaptopyruvate sulfurtransferase